MKENNLCEYNYEYENMSNEEKIEIKKSMSIQEIEHAKNILNIKKEYLNNMYDIYKKSFNLRDVINLSLYNRYYIYAKYHHLSLSCRGANVVKNQYKKELYAQDEYKITYELNQKLLLLSQRIMKLITVIKHYKLGFSDIELNKTEQIQSLKNSIRYISNYLNNEPKSNKEAKHLLSVFKTFNESEILEIIKKNNLNFVNSDYTRYEIFEQIILAPLKLKKYIDLSKYKNKNYNFDELERYLKNSGLWNDEEAQKIEFMKLNNNEFFKIQKNQIKQYCVTIFAEFFSISLSNLKGIYTFFYSNAITSSSKFLNNFYIHISARRENNVMIINEFLPYMHEDFKEIFYEITPNNIPESDIIEYFNPAINDFNKYFECDIFDHTSFILDIDNLPENAV